MSTWTAGVINAHQHGELSRSEHRLITAVFKCDDMVCRRIMQPRNEIYFLDINRSFHECLSLVKGNKHSRYPLCDRSLDNLLDDTAGSICAGNKTNQPSSPEET